MNAISYSDYDYANGLPLSKSYSFQWGDNGKDAAIMNATAYIQYFDSRGGVLDYETVSNSKVKHITIRSIKTPSFSGVSSLENCSQASFTQSVSAGSANDFTWSITGGSGDGTIVLGNGTGTVSIKPPLTGDFQVNVIAKRIGSHPNYSRTGSKSFSRSIRNVDYTVRPVIVNTVPRTPNYVCKGEGRILEIPDDGYISSVVWNSSNSSVNYIESTLGKRVYALYANNNVPVGTQIQATATITYNGGCTATTSTKSFAVQVGETPTVPNISPYMVPMSGDPCNPEGYEVRFSRSYTNGSMLMYPKTIPPHASPNRSYTITVCYINYCSGQTDCKEYNIYPPKPCPMFDFRTDETNFVISPNPNQGNFVVSFLEPQSGQYTIYDLNGVVVKEGEFEESEKLPVFIGKFVKQGSYTIKIITKNFSDYQTLIIE